MPGLKSWNNGLKSILSYLCSIRFFSERHSNGLVQWEWGTGSNPHRGPGRWGIRISPHGSTRTESRKLSLPGKSDQQRVSRVPAILMSWSASLYLRCGLIHYWICNEISDEARHTSYSPAVCVSALWGVILKAKLVEN